MTDAQLAVRCRQRLEQFPVDLLEAVRIEVQSSVTPDQTRANNQEERRTDIVLFPSK